MHMRNAGGCNERSVVIKKKNKKNGDNSPRINSVNKNKSYIEEKTLNKWTYWIISRKRDWKEKKNQNVWILIVQQWKSMTICLTNRTGTREHIKINDA